MADVTRPVIPVLLLLTCLADDSVAAPCDPQETAQLGLAGPEEFNDRFGNAVSIDGDWIAVAIQNDNDVAFEAGAVSMFERRDDAWKHVVKLTADDGAEEHKFGSSVSLSGTTLVVGARQHDVNGPYSGAAYVFELVDGVWEQVIRLTPDEGVEDDEFGNAVGVSGNTIVVGAFSHDEEEGASGAGAAYVFERIDGTWTQTAKLNADEPARGEFFGASVGIAGETIISGAPYQPPHTGSAFVFTRAGGSWKRVTRLQPDDLVEGASFGSAVGIWGGVGVVGAPFDDASGKASGSAYVFERRDGVWIETAKLIPDDGFSGDIFGRSAGATGDALVVGAPWDDDDGVFSGSAYIFSRTGDAWLQVAKLTAGDAETRDNFGRAAAVSGRTAVVAAEFDDREAVDAGSVYVFDLDGCVCPADIDGDDAIGFPDLLLVLAAWDDTGGPSDVDGNGVVDFDDVLAVLAGWGPCT